MKRTLEMRVIEGIKTTIPLQLRIISDPEFAKGNLSTAFLERFNLDKPASKKLAKAV